MGLIHTPRVLYNIGKGYYKRNQRINNHVVPPILPTSSSESSSESTTTSVPNTTNLSGIGKLYPHIYTSRVGLFDIDYLGHMNNAAYLNHCEYARWEMCAYNGLIDAMYRTKVHFVVGSAMIRFRKEIRPLYKQFYIESYVCSLNKRSMYMVQNFRTTAATTKKNTTEQQQSTTTTTTTATNSNTEQRIVAQVIMEGLVIQGRNIIDPADFFIKECAIPPNVIEPLRQQQEQQQQQSSSLSSLLSDDEQQQQQQSSMEQFMVLNYQTLEQSMKEYAAIDDDEIVRFKL